ncbi:MAG: hypothetical protein JRD93_02100 [Deltaproteobacteria bacterium]|nr:hypothetical protein [Deltaproteobacteria bacterium]
MIRFLAVFVLENNVSRETRLLKQQLQRTRNKKKSYLSIALCKESDRINMVVIVQPQLHLITITWSTGREQINADMFEHTEITGSIFRGFYEAYNELGGGFLKSIYKRFYIVNCLKVCSLCLRS